MYDVIVIGAGPAGMMASIVAAKNNKKVLLLEKNSNLGKKLLITGGGRCNITNLKNVNNFCKEISVNSNFLKYSLNVFGPKQIYNYFSDLGVTLKVEDNDRVFPKGDNSGLIVDALYGEIKRYNIFVNYNCSVTGVISNNGEYLVNTNLGNFKTLNVIVATGSRSYPKTGSNGDGYKFAKQLNQPLTELYPSQVSLKLLDPLPLSGITIESVKIKLNNIIKKGSMLFTHKGISGPAVFKISEHVYHEFKNKEEVAIFINFLPDESEESLFEKMAEYNPKKEIKSFIKELVPSRLAEYILGVSKINGSDKIAIISNKNKRIIINNIINYKIYIKNNFMVETSLVTGGGVNLRYINNQTMESTINRGVYFVGELLDVHGSTGGYNITIALATGYVAGSSIT